MSKPNDCYLSTSWENEARNFIQFFNCSLTHFAGKVALFLHLTMRSTIQILIIHDFEQILYEAKKLDSGLRLTPLTTAYNHNHLWRQTTQLDLYRLSPQPAEQPSWPAMSKCFWAAVSPQPLLCISTDQLQNAQQQQLLDRSNLNWL